MHRERSSAAGALLHNSDRCWYLSAKVAAAKIDGADPAETAKKSRKIGRILASELAGGAANRTRVVHQATPGLQCQPLLNQIEGRAAGQAAAQPVQTGFGQRQMPCVALHRPMLEVVRFDQVAEAPQSFRVAAAVDFGTAVCGGAVCQNPQYAACQPAADRSGPTVGLCKFMREPF